MPRKFNVKDPKLTCIVGVKIKTMIAEGAKAAEITPTQFVIKTFKKTRTDLLFLKLLFEQGKVKVYENKLSDSERLRLDAI